MGFEGEIEWQTDQPNGQPRRCLDTEREPKMSLVLWHKLSFAKGLKNTIDWYRKNAESID